MKRGFTLLAIVAFWVVGAEARADFNLTLEGTLATGQSNAVEIRGNLAYVVGGGYFNILDISDPQDISAISSTGRASPWACCRASCPWAATCSSPAAAPTPPPWRWAA